VLLQALVERVWKQLQQRRQQPQQDAFDVLAGAGMWLVKCVEWQVTLSVPLHAPAHTWVNHFSCIFISKSAFPLPLQRQRMIGVGAPHSCLRTRHTLFHATTAASTAAMALEWLFCSSVVVDVLAQQQDAAVRRHSSLCVSANVTATSRDDQHNVW
jgi:hypothetical protein